MFVHSFNDSLVTDDDCCEERGGFSQCTPVPSGLHGIVNFSHRKFESTSDSPLISAAHRTYLQPVQQSSIHPLNVIPFSCSAHTTFKSPFCAFRRGPQRRRRRRKQQQLQGIISGRGKRSCEKERTSALVRWDVCSYVGDAWGMLTDDSIRKRRDIPQRASE